MYACYALLLVIASSVYYWDRIKKELIDLCVKVARRVSSDPTCSTLVNAIAMCFPPSKSSVKITTYATHKVFEFSSADGKLSIPLPFDRTARSFAYIIDDEEEKRAYPKGILFMCTPDQMRVTSITIIHDDESRTKFTGSELPCVPS